MFDRGSHSRNWLKSSSGGDQVVQFTSSEKVFHGVGVSKKIWHKLSFFWTINVLNGTMNSGQIDFFELISDAKAIR